MNLLETKKYKTNQSIKAYAKKIYETVFISIVLAIGVRIQYKSIILLYFSFLYINSSVNI